MAVILLNFCLCFQFSNPPPLLRKIRQDRAGARPVSFGGQFKKENRTQ
jgi:hypothetical protein